MNDKKQQHTCESCGLPSWAVEKDGFSFKVKVKAENRMRRDRTRTVWACSEDCVWCVLAVSEMGEGSHRWPIRLAEFKRLNGRQFNTALGRLDRYEIPPSDPHKQRSSGAPISASGPPVSPLPKEGFRNANRASTGYRKGGRPRKHKSDADRQRAFRQRQRVAA